MYLQRLLLECGTDLALPWAWCLESIGILGDRLNVGPFHFCSTCTYLFVCLFACLCVSLSVLFCLFVSLSVCLPACPFAWLSLCPSVRLSVYLFVYSCHMSRRMKTHKKVMALAPNQHVTYAPGLEPKLRNSWSLQHGRSAWSRRECEPGGRTGCPWATLWKKSPEQMLVRSG